VRKENNYRIKWMFLGWAI